MVNKSKNYRANLKLLAVRNSGKQRQNLKGKQNRKGFLRENEEGSTKDD